ncbi:hypothetical protein ACIPYS_09380 [Kitasatospora sp. NPDC089913]|uniref:hypothetical protein n=1 Tax=Kitasatospora sp. NPDC089913 TaxID=3364080 RepID=UPI003820D4C1
MAVTVAVAAVGVCVLLGRVLGTIAPVTTARPADIALWSWMPVTVYLVLQCLHVDPATARALVSPRDREVLRTLPVGLGRLVAARLVLPGLAVATAVVVLGAAIALPWLSASDTGSQLAATALLHLTGVACTGALARMVLITWLMRPLVRVAHLPRCALAVGCGAVLGVWAGPFLRALGGDPATAGDSAIHRVTDVVRTIRPSLWAEMFEPAAARWAALAYVLVTVAAAVELARRTRAVERATTVRPGAPAHRGRGGRAAVVPTPSGAQVLALRLAWLRLNRADPAVVGGAARLHRLSLLIGTACVAAVIRLGEAPWQLPVPALLGLMVTLAFVASAEVVQICGIESEPRTWQALGQTAVPSGAWPAARAGAAALGILILTAPCYLGIALLCGTRGSSWVPVLLALPLTAVCAGCALVLTWYAVPGAERFDNGRVQRPTSTETVEAVLTLLLLAPATLGCLASYRMLGGTAAALATALAQCVLLIALIAALARIRSTELTFTSPTNDPRKPS